MTAHSAIRPASPIACGRINPDLVPEHLAALLRAEEQHAKDKAWFAAAIACVVLATWLALWVSL